MIEHFETQIKNMNTGDLTTTKKQLQTKYNCEGTNACYGFLGDVIITRLVAGSFYVRKLLSDLLQKIAIQFA